MHVFKLKPNTVETTPITGITGFDKPLKVVTVDDPFLELTDEQLTEFEESGIYHLFEPASQNEVSLATKVVEEEADEKDGLRAQYEELSGKKADKRWSAEKLQELISEFDTGE